MSGGVDSSVAAALLARDGHEVIGLSMQLYDQRASPEAFGSCCSLDDLHDARRVAAALGIPHYIVNFEQRFQDTVVRNFVDEYASGRTPIPCVHCNADLKFATLVERAAGFDAAWVATGHYARVEFDEDRRRYRLLRGRDPDKDQSYFLFSLTQDQLAHALFPVGHLTKREVRAHAATLGLAVAAKPDSHEILLRPRRTGGRFRRAPSCGGSGRRRHRRFVRPRGRTPPRRCIASRWASERDWACRRGRRCTCSGSTRPRGASSSVRGTSWASVRSAQVP